MVCAMFDMFYVNSTLKRLFLVRFSFLILRRLLQYIFFLLFNLLFYDGFQTEEVLNRRTDVNYVYKSYLQRKPS